MAAILVLAIASFFLVHLKACWCPFRRPYWSWPFTPSTYIQIVNVEILVATFTTLFLVQYVASCWQLRRHFFHATPNIVYSRRNIVKTIWAPSWACKFSSFFFCLLLPPSHGGHASGHIGIYILHKICMQISGPVPLISGSGER